MKRRIVFYAIVFFLAAFSVSCQLMIVSSPSVLPQAAHGRSLRGVVMVVILGSFGAVGTEVLDPHDPACPFSPSLHLPCRRQSFLPGQGPALAGRSPP